MFEVRVCVTGEVMVRSPLGNALQAPITEDYVTRLSHVYQI